MYSFACLFVRCLRGVQLAVKVVIPTAVFHNVSNCPEHWIKGHP